METVLAIYEALIQANVPQPAARRVAEALEKDMTSTLATKQDFQHFSELMMMRFETFEKRTDAKFDAFEKRVDEKFEAFEKQMNAKFDASDRRMEARFGVQDGQFALKMESVESRLVIKLGILITVLFGVTGTIVALLR